MIKAAKPGAEEPAAPPPKKSNKKIIIIASVAVLLIGGGTAAFFLMKPSHPAKTDEAVAAVEEKAPGVPPTYVQLGTFTANLVHEEGDRYLQVSVELKVSKPELKDTIKAANPEILHHVNMLLQSKRPSELVSFSGKQKLAEQIKAQVEYILGFRKTPISITDSEAASNLTAQNASTKAQSAPTETQDIKSDIAEVLFTSFIIQ